MKRIDDWIKNLDAVVLEYQNARWSRGSRDCGTFAADCVVAVCGDDIIAPFRGKYTDLMGLHRQLRAGGHTSIEQYVSDWMTARAFPEIPHSIFAQCGDLGLTVNGVACIRHRQGFVAMAEAGGLYLVNPNKVWAVAWE